MTNLVHEVVSKATYFSGGMKFDFYSELIKLRNTHPGVGRDKLYRTIEQQYHDFYERYRTIGNAANEDMDIQNEQ